MSTATAATAATTDVSETKHEDKLQESKEFILILICGDPAERTDIFLVPANKIDADARRLLELSWLEVLGDDDDCKWDQLLDMLKPHKVNLKPSKFGPSRLIIDTIRAQY